MEQFLAEGREESTSVTSCLIEIFIGFGAGSPCGTISGGKGGRRTKDEEAVEEAVSEAEDEADGLFCASSGFFGLSSLTS